MSSIPDGFPISLQSWPSTEGDPKKSLPFMIQRIRDERGGFLNANEESLRREIAEAGADDEDDGTSEEEDDEEEEKPDRQKELMKAREEMLAQIEYAHQHTMFALDFVSLLLSKDQPTQASMTISPFLRETLPLGTLGADKIHASKVTDAVKEDNKHVAKGFKIQNLNKTVDSILASASRLEKEIEVETKYWEQVLAVSENGWAVCRLPNEKQTLGVRFGFSEASATFRNRSLAALRREPDGSIYLDQGIATAEPQYVRVRIQSNIGECGSSTVPSATADDAPIEARIQQARNTIFDTELWQELNREARTLASFGVRSKDDTITCPLSPNKTIILDLVSLDDYSPAPPRSDDYIAEGISLALHLLLSYAHRQNFHRRTQTPAPLSAYKRPNPPYALLRPLISRVNHQSTLSSIHALLVPLCSILTSTSLSPPPTYTITKPSRLEQLSKLPPTEATILSLIDHLQVQLTLSLTPACNIILKTRTLLFPLANTNFNLTLEPADSFMREACRAPGVVDHWRKAHDYILFATSCALAGSFASPPTKVPEGENGAGGAARWEATTRPHVLRRVQGQTGQGKSKHLSFSLEDFTASQKKGLRLRVSWEWMGGVLEHMPGGLDSRSPGAGRGKKVVKGEGFYEWVLLEGESQVVGRGMAGEGGAWVEGVPVKSLKEVVEIAERD